MNICTLTELSVFNELRIKLKQSNELNALSSRGNSMCSAALNLYEIFLKDNNVLNVKC